MNSSSGSENVVLMVHNLSISFISRRKAIPNSTPIQPTVATNAVSSETTTGRTRKSRDSLGSMMPLLVCHPEKGLCLGVHPTSLQVVLVIGLDTLLA